MMKKAIAALALVALCGVLPAAAQETQAPQKELNAKAEQMVQEAEGKVEKAEQMVQEAEGEVEKAEQMAQEAEGMAGEAAAQVEEAEGMAEKIRDAGATLEEVLEAHYEAVGGKEAWQAVEAVRYEGTMSMAPGMDAPFKMTMQRPDMIRLEFTFQNMTGIQAAHGDTAWMVMPFMGKSTPEAMPAEMAEQFREQADIEGPLFDWADKGHQVELLGVVDVEGTDAYKVQLTLDKGDVRYHFLDTEYHLAIKQEGKAMVQGQEMEIETDIGDYKAVCAATSVEVDEEHPCDGAALVVPHSIVSKAKGAPAGQAITITHVAVNPSDIPADYFAMPVEEADEADPAAKPGA